MQTPEMIGSYRPPLPTPMLVMGTYRPSMGPPGPSLGPPGPSLIPPGHHIGPTWQHMGHSGQQMGPSWQHMAPSWQHMGLSGQHMKPPGQYMEPSRQHMGHPGLGMGPTGPITSFLGMSGSQMGSLEMPSIPQVQLVKPNYSVPNSNLIPVQPVNQSAADNLWLKNITPTVQLQPNQTEVTGHNIQPLKLYFDHFKTHLPSAMVQPAMVQSAVVRPQVLAFLEEINMATEASQAKTSVQQNAAKDVKTHSEKKKKQQKRQKKSELKAEQKPETKAEQKPEPKAEQKPEPKAEQKPATKSRPVASTPIPGTVWCVVQTNDGKHFFYNPTNRKSVWKIPEELKKRPDVEKLLSPKPEVKTKIKEEKDLQEEPPSKKIKLEVEMNREKEEVTQQIVLEKETTNAIKVQTTENMPVVSLEDRKKKFKELLAKNNVSTCSTWGKELHKVVFDKNYMLLTSRERKQAFEEYVNDRVEEERMERKRKCKLFIQLLEESNLNVKSTFKSFAAMHSHDERFKMILTHHDREQMFEDYINGLVQKEKKKKALIREKVKDDFMKMLSEIPGIDPCTSWVRDVKNKVNSDPRYKALRYSQREELFETYLKTLKAVKDDFMKMLSEIPGIDPSTCWGDWGDVKNKVSSDPRYKAVSDSHREEWFKTYLLTMKKVKADFIQMLSEILDIYPSTSWGDVKNKVRSDPRYKAVKNSHREEWFKTYLKTVKEVEEDFLKKLSEIPGIDLSTSWGYAKTKISIDPRYRAVSNSRREEWFKTYLNTLMELKDDFMKMLKEIPDIDPSTSWDDVKNKVSSDPRYKAVSDFRREEWLKMYLKTMTELKGDFMKMLSEIPEIDTNTTWSDVKNKVSSDPRYKTVSDTRQEEWFKMYLKAMKEVKDDFMEMLNEIPGIFPTTSWYYVNNKVSSDPRFKAVSGFHREEWFKMYMKTMMEVKNDFIKMLREIPDLDPSTSWNDVKNKMSSDPRYKAVSDSRGEEWFESYLFTIKKVQDDYMKMLSEIPGIDPSTTWSDVKNKVSTYPRFKAVSDSRREEWFKTYLNTLKEVKDDFMKMLSEIPDIDTSTCWYDLKNKVSSDPRYKAVSDSHRMKWFNAYLKTMMEVKYDFVKMLSEIPDIDRNPSWGDVKNIVSSDSRYKAVSDSHREEWFKTYLKTVEVVQRDFMKMLSEIPGIDSNTSWDDVKNQVSIYPRYKAVYDSHREEWFKTYLNTLKEVKVDFMKMLSEIPGIEPSTSWGDVKNKVSYDPQFKAVSGSCLEEWFKTYLKAMNEVKDDFMKMLSEIPEIDISTSWGDVKNKVSSDPRYKAASDTRREEWFKMYLKTVKEVIDDFMKMLSEIPDIDTSTSWDDVKNIVSTYPRYKAVNNSRREELFKTYLNTLKEVKGDFMKMMSEIPGIYPSTSWDYVKYKVSEDPRFKAVSGSCQEKWFKMYLKTMNEGKVDFMKMLIEIPGIDPSTSWDDVKNKVSSDPRCKAVSDTRQKEWFKMYLKPLKEVKDDFMKMLSEITDINPSTNWVDGKNKVSSDPRYKAVSDSCLEEWFKRYLKMKDDFMKMMSEIPGIYPSTSWDYVKYKVSEDPRFKAVSGSCQEKWFKMYLKTMNEGKVDFMKMLIEIPGIDTSTSWDDVKNKVSSDPRCKAVSDTRQKEWFKMYLKPLKEPNDDFMKMLSEIPDINPSTRWADLKNKISSDPRYKAVSHSRREEWFKTYLKNDSRFYCPYMYS